MSSIIVTAFSVSNIVFAENTCLCPNNKNTVHDTAFTKWCK